MIERLKRELDKIDIPQLAAELISIPSYSFLENQEKAIAEYIYQKFVTEGIECQLTEVSPGRFNVYGCIPGTREGKSLMLCGHLDTVPPYDMKDAFTAKIHNGRLYGRGSCDMKGPVAAMLATLFAVKRSGITLPGDLYFAGLADEEVGALGVNHFIKYGPVCDGTIVGEPTSLNIAIGHKGLEWINVYFEGNTVHGGNQDQGINAIEMAGRFINRVYQEYIPVLKGRRHPILGEPTINIGKIQGGDQPSTVAGSCRLELDRRFVLTERHDQVLDELRTLCQELHQEDPAFKADVQSMFEAGDFIPLRPFCIDKDDPLILSVLSALDAVHERKEITVFPAWSDAGTISNETESSCIVMGPGDLAVAHSSEEYVPISQLKAAAYIYGLTAIEYCR